MWKLVDLQQEEICVIQGAFIRKLNNEARNAQHTVKVELAFPATLLKEKWVLLVQGLHHNNPQKCVLLIWPPDDQSNRPRLPLARGFLWIQTRGEMNRAGAREGRRCQTMLRCHSPEQSCPLHQCTLPSSYHFELWSYQILSLWHRENVLSAHGYTAKF